MSPNFTGSMTSKSTWSPVLASAELKFRLSRRRKGVPSSITRLPSEFLLTGMGRGFGTSGEWAAGVGGVAGVVAICCPNSGKGEEIMPAIRHAIAFLCRFKVASILLGLSGGNGGTW